MIKDCQINSVLICNKTDKLHDVARKLKLSEERHAFVVDDGKPIGVISTVDIVYKSLADGFDPYFMVAEEVMTTPVQFVESDQEEEFALKVMMEKNTLSCPVVSDKQLIGVVSYNDIFNKVANKVK